MCFATTTGRFSCLKLKYWFNLSQGWTSNRDVIGWGRLECVCIAFLTLFFSVRRQGIVYEYYVKLRDTDCEPGVGNDQSRLSAEQVTLLTSKQTDHPGKTVTDPAKLEAALSKLRATFISEESWLTMSRESDLIDALKQESTWDFKTIAGGHWPMLTIPEELSELLHEINT